jgi:hypothetical protein
MTYVSEAIATPAGRAVDAGRVVLLGASNLTKAIGTVVETARRGHGPGLELLIALGHGRSYGRSSRVLGRRLPGILECGLWRQLALGPAERTMALVTDIGNDLLYEEPVARIVRWVEECLDRLAAAGARTVVTPLPLANLASLSAARYRLMRSLFFPYSRISLGEVSRRAHELDAHVRRLAHERRFATVEQKTTWYGFDPIHIRFTERPRAWGEILAPWSATREAIEPVGHCLTRSLRLRLGVPAHRELFGIVQRGHQPMARLRGGTTVSLY